MNKKTRRLVERVAQGLGYRVVPEWRMERLAQSCYLKRLFDVARIDCVFDVGANMGQFAEYLRHEVDYRGWIVSYEPVPECLRALENMSGKDAKWVVRPCALGRKAGIQSLNVMRDSQFSSFLLPASEAIVPGEILDMNKVDHVVHVEVNTLDAEIRTERERLGFARPYLKLDTQGYDAEVMAGAGAAITSFLALQTEMSVVPIYEGVPSIDDQMERYSQQGFAVGAIFPNNPEHFPCMLEFDCHFINKAFFTLSSTSGKMAQEDDVHVVER